MSIEEWLHYVLVIFVVVMVILVAIIQTLGKVESGVWRYIGTLDFVKSFGMNLLKVYAITFASCLAVWVAASFILAGAMFFKAFAEAGLSPLRWIF